MKGETETERGISKRLKKLKRHCNKLQCVDGILVQTTKKCMSTFETIGIMNIC